jgi:hypothetical protein
VVAGPPEQLQQFPFVQQLALDYGQRLLFAEQKESVHQVEESNHQLSANRFLTDRQRSRP